MQEDNAAIANCLDKLERIENDLSKNPQTKTLEALFQTGTLTACEPVKAGDFNLLKWSHSFDSSFSVGALERVRHDGNGFPKHEHEQHLWLLCSKGVARLHAENGHCIDLEKGDYTVVEPMTPHTILAQTKECVVLMVTIPKDPGLHP